MYIYVNISIIPRIVNVLEKVVQNSEHTFYIRELFSDSRVFYEVM
jgi:hypothetical protein